MKLGIISESDADEAALGILIPVIVGVPVEIIPRVWPPPGGWSSALAALSTAMNHLYYRTDADALVVVIDSDDTPIHTTEHEPPNQASQKCRACQFLENIDRLKSNLARRPVEKPFVVAVGLAVPAIESWYLCGVDVHATEAHFARELQALGQMRQLRNNLKKAAYGTDRPSLALEKTKAIEHATRLSRSLEFLRQNFPEGFGLLERTISPLLKR